MMALRIACCACCMTNLNRVGGWTYVVPRKSLMSDHGIELNQWKSMIASS